MKLEKITKKLSEDAISQLNVKSVAELHQTVAESEESISRATRERDALPGYQAAKQAVKDLSEGLKEVKGYQRAKIEYCLRRLRELNGEQLGDEE